MPLDDVIQDGDVGVVVTERIRQDACQLAQPLEREGGESYRYDAPVTGIKDELVRGCEEEAGVENRDQVVKREWDLQIRDNWASISGLSV